MVSRHIHITHRDAHKPLINRDNARSGALECTHSERLPGYNHIKDTSMVISTFCDKRIALEKEFWKQLHAAQKGAITARETSGEIETRHVYPGRNVYCEKLHQIDWNLDRPFQDSKL